MESSNKYALPRNNGGGFDGANIEVMSLTDRRLKTTYSPRKFCSSRTDIAEDLHLEDDGHDGRFVPG
jgi:hypothetical protein